MKSGKWDRNTYVGTSMVGKTLAIYGFGKVRKVPNLHAGACLLPWGV